MSPADVLVVAVVVASLLGRAHREREREDARAHILTAAAEVSADLATLSARLDALQREVQEIRTAHGPRVSPAPLGGQRER